MYFVLLLLFFFQAEDGIRDLTVTGVQTCALPICLRLQLGIRERLEALLVTMNRVHDRTDALHLTLEARADDPGEPALDHQSSMSASVSGTAPARRCSRAPRRARGSESTGPAARAPGSSSQRRPAPARRSSG